MVYLADVHSDVRQKTGRLSIAAAQWSIRDGQHITAGQI